MTSPQTFRVLNTLEGVGTPDELRRKLIRLVESEYPKWEGFGDPRLVKDEREDKLATAAKAQELLSRSALESLIAAGSHDEIISRIRSVAYSTNLLYLANPSQGDLALLYHPDLQKPAFSLELLEMLHGTGSTLDRLTRWVGWLEERSLPNKWTFTTYLLFLLHPDRDLLVKPTVTQRFVDLVGLACNAQGPLVPTTYQTLADLASDLRALLADYKPQDMIDIQALMWTCSVVAQKYSVLPGKWKSLRHRIQVLAADPKLSENALEYQQAREQFRKNWREVLSLRERGDDPTDAVMRLLLPHPAAAPDGTPGVWFHPANRGGKPIYEHAESVGWIDSAERANVAKALIAFFETCETDPGSLEAACAQLAELVPKGIASGSLSPGLNALRPDEYALVTNASRELIKDLTGKKPGQPMVQYSAANSRALKLIADIEPALSEHISVDAHPGDLVDLLAQIESSDTPVAESVAPYTSGGRRYWKIAPGEQAFHWTECLKGGFIALGWEELGDLTGISRAEFDKRVQHWAPLRDWKISGLNQVWTFVKEIRPGDIIIANRGISEVLGVGEVTGDYYFVDDEVHGHRIPVTWTHSHPFPVREEGWRRTLVRLAEAKGKAYLDQAAQEPVVSDPIRPPKSLAAISDETGLPLPTLEGWVRALRRKRQAVFYGPPGTGKTFVAKHLADYLVGNGGGFVELVQFHPACAYEDFIQGIRPLTNDGVVTYELTPGRFMEVCERARKTKGVCVLIIDEINRANLSRVFGELMYLLEYREARVPLAGGATLSVPENLYLIGTMNTADRSIALVDHALRRRFAFLELRPQYEALRRFHERAAEDFDASGLIAVLERANQQIADPNYELGISFFTRGDLAYHLEDIWTMEIVPYLEEYFFDRADKVGAFRWNKVRDEILGE